MHAQTATVAQRARTAGVLGWLKGLAREIAPALRAHAVYLSCIGIYAALCPLVAGQFESENAVELRLVSQEAMALVAAFAISGTLGCLAAVAVAGWREGSFTTKLRETAGLLRRDQLLAFLLATLPIPLFASTFSSFKRLIPAINPYEWDATFMAWDAWLHGGHAWELLQPLFGHPYATAVLNASYSAWFGVVFFTWLWQAISLKHGALRMRFLVSFILCWIIVGTVAAVVFSSGGPVYFGRLTGLADPYAPLMAYLNAANAVVPVGALEVQEQLWGVYETRQAAFGAGISAMPSMHVASSVLLALFGWHIGPRVGLAYTLFAAVIFLGSIHLGWHYAVDGYVAAILTVLIWWAAGRLMRVRAGPHRA